VAFSHTNQPIPFTTVFGMTSVAPTADLWRTHEIPVPGLL
jgi:hypothetical protein